MQEKSTYRNDDSSSLLLLSSREMASTTFARNDNFDPNNTINKSMIRDTLQAAWTRATAGFVVVNVGDADEWWERIWKMHADDSARHYHTAVHLYEMLGYFQMILQQQQQQQQQQLSDENQRSIHDISTEDEQAILLAIFFHDAVYDAKSNNNEEESIKLFQSFVEYCKQQKSQHSDQLDAIAENVCQFIAATKKHTVSPDHGTALALFLDLDMAVLGKEADAYDSYALLIRKEYSFVLREIYCEKRADILTSFLCNGASIYGTSLFREAFEERARSNLSREIELLRKGIIPGE